MEQTKETWGEIPNEPCDFPLECEHGSTGRCDKCGIETWGERFDEGFDHIIPKIMFGEIGKKEIKAFIEKEISSAVQKERERLLEEIENLLFTSDSLTDLDLKRGMMSMKYPEIMNLYQEDMQNRIDRWQKFKVSALNERDI